LAGLFEESCLNMHVTLSFKVDYGYRAKRYSQASSGDQVWIDGLCSIAAHRLVVFLRPIEYPRRGADPGSLVCQNPIVDYPRPLAVPPIASFISATRKRVVKAVCVGVSENLARIPKSLKNISE